MALLQGTWIGDIFEREVPSGTVNGVNTSFTLSSLPHSAKAVDVYINGLLQRLTTDYTISGSIVSFVIAPSSGQVVYVSYIKG